MGDCGVMGVKTKVLLRLLPDPPFKARRYYMLAKDDYNQVFKLAHKMRMEVGDGLNDLMVWSSILFQLVYAQTIMGNINDYYFTMGDNDIF